MSLGSAVALALAVAASAAAIEATFDSPASTITGLAYDQGNIWVACDNVEHSIRCYDTSGALVGSIDRSLVPDAEGLTMDPEGFLWASDNVNGLIYKIDPLGTGLIPSSWACIKSGEGH